MIGIQHVPREFQREADCVAVVVVGDVMSPVDQRRPVFFGISQVPVVDIDHAVAPVDFDDRRDQGDDVVANRLT